MEMHAVFSSEKKMFYSLHNFVIQFDQSSFFFYFQRHYVCNKIVENTSVLFFFS